MPVVGVPADIGRLVRASEPGVVGHHAAVSRVAQRGKDGAPEKRPRRLGVDEQHGRSVALVEVGETKPLELAVARGKGKVEEAGKALPRRAHGGDGDAGGVGTSRSWARRGEAAYGPAVG